MKFSLLQQDLLSALSATIRSCGFKSSLPVLANILVQARDGKLKLSATNLEIGVVKSMKAEVIEEGEVTIPAKTLLDILGSLSGAMIEIESSGENIKISSQAFKATLNGISASEFPTIPMSSENSIKISAKALQTSLPQVSFAAAADEGRPILTGILTEIRKNALEIVATDGFRLAHKTSKIESTSEEGSKFRVLIPKRTFDEVIKLISEESSQNPEGNMQVEISTSENQNQIVFCIGETLVSSRLIEGQFPSWEKIIPEKFVTKSIVDRVEALKAVKLASVFARGDSSNIIKIQFKPSQIKITSETKEIGSQETDIPAQTEGEELLVAFNSKFLIDVLANANSENIEINLSGNLSPALFKPISPDSIGVGEEGLEYVIMPVRLS